MRHGGNLRELALQAGLEPDQVVDFSASINPLGPPQNLRAVLARSIDRLVYYPDPACTELVRLLAERHQASPGQIVVGNGSTEILFALARAIPFSQAIIPVPSYVDYAEAVRVVGREVRFLGLEESSGFALDWAALEKELGVCSDISPLPLDGRGAGGEGTLNRRQIPTPLTPDPSPVERERGELVLLGQPNNPTGRALDADAIRAVASRYPGATLVVDEAFADFMEEHCSLADHVPANVIVVRSLTKFYAIPGLRLGYAVASPALAEKVRGQIPPWSVNLLAQEAAVACLSDAEYARRSVALVGDLRRRLAEEMAKLPDLFVYPSVTNFLLARLDRRDLTAHDMARRLLREGIAVRTFTADQHLDDRFFRVAVRTEEENRRMCDALAALLSGGEVFQRPPARRLGLRPDLILVGTESQPTRSRHAENVPHGRAAALMIQGTTSNAGKSVLTAALCRILLQDGVRVAPFKSQNMSLNSFVTSDGGEMGRAQVVQAQACRLEPDVRMNPILLKPNSDTGCQVIVRGKPVGNMRVGEYLRYKPQAFAAAKVCYDSLAAEFDVIVLEGAGSPGEVNLKSHDIVNMRMAEYAGAPVLIAGDIDRGGVFASFVGTMEVLAPWERKRVAGWIVNRFRGDASLLDEALNYTLLHTGRPVLGVVHYLPDLGLPQEDSVEFKSGAMDQAAGDGAAVEIAVIDLPHISNFTDFDAFRIEGDVRLRIVRSAAELDRPDAVILPGSKNTLGDLGYLRRSGLAERIVALARDGAEIVGICGGLQILGREICDPLGIESSHENHRGLGLLDVGTVMAAEKTLVRTSARHEPSGMEVAGYEIHHGQTTLGGGPALFTSADGRVLGVAGGDRRIWGTYLHGVFDADAFRRWFIDGLRVRRCLPPVGKVTGRYDIEPALDRLADTVRASLRMDEVYRLLGLK